MADPDFVSDLEFMIARRGNQIIHQQSAFLQSTVSIDPPAPMEDEGADDEKQGFRRPVQVDRGNPGVDVINVDLGGTSGLGSVADQSARPAGGGRPKKQGRKLPVLVSAVVKFGLGEVDIAPGAGDSPDASIATIRAHGSMFGAYTARALVDPQLPEPVADVNAGSTSFTVPRMNGWIEGSTVDVVDDASGNVVFQMDIDVVRGNFDGTATVVPASATPALLDVSAQSIFLKGQGDSDTRFGAMVDLTNSSLDLYGLDADTEFPSGISEAVGGPWSNEDGKNAVSILAATGDQPDCWHTSKRGRDKIVNAQNDNVRFIPGMGDNSRDPFNDAMLPEFAGLPIVACNQGDDTVIRVGNFKRMVLREHVRYGARMPSGGSRAELGRGALFTSEGSHALKLLCDGWYSMVCTKRRAFLEFTGVTA